MRKFIVGERYKVGGKHDEAGNIIEITRVGSGRCMYKTIKGKAPEPWTESFDKKSSFAKNLTLSTGGEKVVILRDGNTVTAAQYIDGVKVNAGVAKCSPEDSFDFGTGAKIAFDRMFGFAEPTLETAFDWNKFSSGDLYVELNRKNMDSFLKECEERGYKWMSGELATERNLFRDYDKMPDGAKFIAAILGAALGEKIFVRVLRGKLAVNNKALPGVEVCKWECFFHTRNNTERK